MNWVLIIKTQRQKRFLMSMLKGLTCFKTYDVRGKLGEELNED